MATLVNSLEQLGYIDGQNLFGAPYDFRYGLAAEGHPSKVGTQNLEDLKELIESASASNGGKPVILLSHSLGGLFALQLLVRSTSSWRQKYVKHLLTLSAPWAGTVQEMLTFASGYTLGIPIVDPLLVRAEQRSSESNLWLLPSPTVFGHKPLVVSGNKSYSAWDMQEFMEDIGFEEGVYPYKTRVLPMTDKFEDPGVPVTCVVGSGVETPETLFYGEDGFDVQPEVVYGDGDGTVNLVSLLALESEWPGSASQDLKVIRVPGVSHTSILKDKSALTEIVAEICSINAITANSLVFRAALADALRSFTGDIAPKYQVLGFLAMPQFQQPACWRLEAGGQVMDVDTAVKDGILGGGVVIRGLLDGKDGTLDTAKKHDLKEMIEEMDSAAEADDVPIVFICPISLEPMVDPVTLCTGQTYERVNILRWFSTGRLTCPTTMQDIWDDTVTPNRTLHQLIHSWFSQRFLRTTKRSEDVEGRARDLVQCLKKVKGEAKVQTLKELHKIVAAHPSVEKPVIDSGVLSILSSLLGPFTTHAVGSEVIAVLVNLSLDSETMTDLMQPAKISLVVDMLNEGTTKTKIQCTRFIEVLMGAKSFRSEIISSPSLSAGLLRMVKDKRDPDGVSAGLSLLKTICSHNQVRSSIVSVRAVAQLVEQLPELSPNSLESALQILDDLAAIPEGRTALKDCPQTIPNTVRPLMKVSEACTRHALSILWAVCKLAPEEFVSVAVEGGLATRLLLVIQSDCPPALKKQASDLLKLCSLNYTATLFISKCKLTRTMQ
ncbi:hypothetical protein B296_00051043 [Ensete ventricosum]|uniref:U-box domain-containing protein n=1 Tax=Ensete ventricosum TaxID=4639 RepID=A0A426YII2_ENSVE|nr:hypothetical protein B296_00051043 [Ensete ventricosum]